jgi:uncharacterized delta-60 repeat protein
MVRATTLFLLFCISLSDHAEGTLQDSSFETGFGPNRAVYDIALSSDGKIYVAGAFTEFNGFQTAGLVRLNLDGSLDETFRITSSFQNVYGLAVQPDGKLLVSAQKIYRLNSDGSIDSTFNEGVGVNGYADITLQADLKILVWGWFQKVNGVSQSGLARLNNDGSLDTNFKGFAGATYSAVKTLALQSDGKIIIGGPFEISTGEKLIFARLNADGSYDSSFASLSSSNYGVSQVVVQSDDRIVVSGGPLGKGNEVFRVSSEGIRDPSFQFSTEFLTTHPSTTILGDRKDRILMFDMLTFEGFPIDMVRVNQDGSRDWSFDPGPLYGGVAWPISEVRPLALVQSDGKILMVRAIDNDVVNKDEIVRLNESSSASVFYFGSSAAVIPEANGTATLQVIRGGPANFSSCVGWRLVPESATPGKDYVDGSGQLVFGPGERVKSIEVKSIDDEVVAETGETFDVILEDPSENGEITAPASAKITIQDDDLADKNFDPGLKKGDSVISFLVQPDGKIVVSGFFTNVHGVPRNGFARLFSDGSLDTSFNAGNETFGWSSMLLLPDGKIIIGRGETNSAGIKREVISRLTEDGQLDPSFYYDGKDRGFLISTDQLLLQPDGKILVRGLIGFKSLTFNGFRLLLRLNADGRVDDSFDTTLPPEDLTGDVATCMGIQSDGKIIVGRRPSSVSPSLIRLFPDGTRDLSFITLDSSTTPDIMIVQPDGKILIGRNRGSPNLLRLNSDGSRDTSFHSPWFEGLFDAWGVIFYLGDIAIAPDHSIAIGGAFWKVDGYPRYGLVHLSENGIVDANFQPALLPEASGRWWEGDIGGPRIVRLAFTPAGKILVGGDVTVAGSIPLQIGLNQFGLDTAVDVGLRLEPVTFLSNGAPEVIGQSAPFRLLLESSSNLVHWTPVYTNLTPLTPLVFQDESGKAAAQRFYRLGVH